MEEKPILVVDDEKNIRMTVSQSLDTLEIPIETAANGEEAIQKLRQKPFRLVFLDLRMPGINGMDVLRRIKDDWPSTRVIIISAHGTIESAVEAMKLGAIDFIQKPFSPGEIRDLATQVLKREQLDEASAEDYRSLIELAKLHISNREFGFARETTQKAIAFEPAHPEAYNLFGALLEIKGDKREAQNFYRAALDIDPTFKPAWANLERTASWNKFGPIDLGPDDPGKAEESDNSEAEADET